MSSKGRNHKPRPANNQNALHHSQTARDQAVIQPQDHKPAKTQTVAIDFHGRSYKFRADALENIYVLDELAENRISSALRIIIGVDQYQQFLADMDDGTGFVSVETVGEMFEKITAASSSKNS